MKWLWIAVLAFMAVCVLDGYRKGLIKTVFALCSTIVALVVTMVAAPVVGKALQNNEKVNQLISSKIESVIDQSEVGQDETASKPAVGEASDQYIEQLPIPAALRDELMDNCDLENYKAMAVKSLKDYVVQYLTRTILNAIAFIGVFLVVRIVLAIVCSVLNLISKLPVLNGLNKTAGAAAGLVHALVIVWVGGIVLTAFSGTALGADLFAQVKDNAFLSFLYDNNLLLKIISAPKKVI